MSETEYSVLIERMNGLTTLINSQSTATHDLLGEVNKRLDKINGKVNKHEDQITEALIERAKNRQEQKTQSEVHYSQCPNTPRIQELETKYRIGISKKQLVVAIVAFVVSLTSIAYSSIKINEAVRMKDMKQIIEQVDSLNINK
jgi:hypothetical protein